MATRHDLQGPNAQNRGCWFAISRCFISKPVDKVTAPIEFENLVTADKRASELYQRSQLVTVEEREHVMSGNYDNLLTEQERKDRERDEELKRQEEALRMEEEAYYAAKRGASRKLASHVLTDTSSAEVSFSTGQTHSSPGSQTHSSPSSQTLTGTTPTLSHDQSSIQAQSENGQSGADEMGPWTSASEEPSNKARTVTKDEEDFDKFLESVKAKQLSLNTKIPEVNPSLSDSEEEIDFGFWEKAASLPSDKTHTPSQSTKELDLNLL